MKYWDVVEKTAKILSCESDCTNDAVTVEESILDRITNAANEFANEMFGDKSDDDIRVIMLGKKRDWWEKLNTYLGKHNLNSTGATRAAWVMLTGDRSPL